jgi:hypothetical protein
MAIFSPSASVWRQNSDLNGFGSKTGDQEILSCCDHYYLLALPKTVIQFTLDRGFRTQSDRSSVLREKMATKR